MSLRQITLDAATFSSTTGSSVDASGTARFRRKRAFTSGGQLIIPGHVDAAYAAGAFTTPLYLSTPDDPDQAAAYTVTISGETYDFSLSAGSAVDLALLIAVGGTEDVSAVEMALAALTLDGLADVDAAAPADGEVLAWDATLETWIAAAASGDVTQDELDAETTSRQTADAALQLDIDAETAARIAADTAEANARAGADTLLQTNLTALSTAVTARLTQAQADALYQSIAAPTVYTVGVGGNPAYGGTWSSYAAGTLGGFYVKDRGIVRAGGTLKNATAATNDVIWTLPLGFRPPEIVYGFMTFRAATLAPYPIRVDTNGNIVFLGGSGNLGTGVVLHIPPFPAA